MAQDQANERVGERQRARAGGRLQRDRVRDEAERLVAAAIAAVSLAARGMGAAGRSGQNFATGSAECCICPVCRLIASMRDPSTDLADKLAAGAGDLATGVASMLRALNRPSHPDDRADRADRDDQSREGDEFWESLRQRATEQARSWSSGGWPGRSRPTDVDGDETDVESDPWRAATARTGPPPPTPMAKKAIAKKAVVKKSVRPVSSVPGAAEPAAPPTPIAPTSRPTTKAAPKKTTGSGLPKAVPPQAKAVPKTAAPKKAAPKKTTPSKATPTKAVPPPEEFG